MSFTRLDFTGGSHCLYCTVCINIHAVEYLENNTILNEAISEIALPTVETFQVPSSGGMSQKLEHFKFYIPCMIQYSSCTVAACTF